MLTYKISKFTSSQPINASGKPIRPKVRGKPCQSIYRRKIGIVAHLNKSETLKLKSEDQL